MKQEHSVASSSLAQGELLKSLCARALGTAGLALILGVVPGGIARAQTAPVSVPDKSFPESLTSTKDGTIYVGSFNLGGVVKSRTGRKSRAVHQARHRRQSFGARCARRRKKQHVICLFQ
jgi:hypothetical protein